MSRKKTPDLMQEMMSDNKTISREKQYNNKEIRQENNKVRSTYSLSVSTLEKIEETWINLRRKFKGNARITKTLIVERAIEIAFKELEEKGEKSSLFVDLSN